MTSLRAFEIIAVALVFIFILAILSRSMKRLLVLFFLVSFLFPSPLFAQTNAPSMVVSLPAQPVTPTPVSVDYTLPYPGILPDNPLYFLKTIRDNVVGWLISNPEKKAQFDILQADKRLQSGVYLLQEGKSKSALAISTISKGQNYLIDAIAKVQEAKKQIMATDDVDHTLYLSSEKEGEVLQHIAGKIDPHQTSDFKLLQKRAADIEKQAAKLDKNK